LFLGYGPEEDIYSVLDQVHFSPVIDMTSTEARARHNIDAEITTCERVVQNRR